MANSEKQAPVTIQELLVSGLAQTDALAKLLIEKGVITQQEFHAKISEGRAIYQRMLNPTQHQPTSAGVGWQSNRVSDKVRVVRSPALLNSSLVLFQLLVVQATQIAWAQSRPPQEPSAVEQLLIYELNRARNNPARFGQENNLVAELSGVAPQPPLAVNNNLVGSASFHAEEMATFNYIGHQSAITGDWPNKMARDNGYPLPSSYPNDKNYIESLSGGAAQGAALLPLASLIEDRGLIPPGHRIHLLGMSSFVQTHREIGTGTASAFNGSLDFWVLHTAVRDVGGNQFLTGVAFNDTNHNGRLDLGEGLAGVTISNGVTSVQTNDGGGWSIEVAPGTFTVTASGGGFVATASAVVSVTDNNVEADFISGNAAGEVNFSLQIAISVVAAVLPSSRSVQVGTPATAFATIINAGSTTATACGLSLKNGFVYAFSYQTTNPATNQVTGTPNTPVDIAAGAFQTYVFSITPNDPAPLNYIELNFNCTNTNPAPLTIGVNGLWFTASDTPVPDVVALAGTLPPDPGIVNIPGNTGTGVFVVATVNLGVGASITASADSGGTALPVILSLCQTNPSTSACLAPPSSSVTTTINANATPTFGIFVQGTDNVEFNPARKRVFVRFKDAGNVTRGSTSVAVRTISN